MLRDRGERGRGGGEGLRCAQPACEPAALRARRSGPDRDPGGDRRAGVGLWGDLPLAHAQRAPAVDDRHQHGLRARGRADLARFDLHHHRAGRRRARGAGLADRLEHARRGRAERASDGLRARLPELRSEARRRRALLLAVRDAAGAPGPRRGAGQRAPGARAQDQAAVHAGRARARGLGAQPGRGGADRRDAAVRGHPQRDAKAARLRRSRLHGGRAARAARGALRVSRRPARSCSRTTSPRGRCRGIRRRARRACSRRCCSALPCSRSCSSWPRTSGTERPPKGRRAWPGARATRPGCG